MATFKEKMKGLVNKASDSIINAKQTYEKECETLECFSLNDIRESKEVKAIRDKKTSSISFSDSLDVLLKDIPKNWIFVSEEGEYITIDEKALTQENIEVTLKTKKDNHIITNTKYKIVKLAVTSK